MRLYRILIEVKRPNYDVRTVTLHVLASSMIEALTKCAERQKHGLAGVIVSCQLESNNEEVLV